MKQIKKASDAEKGILFEVLGSGLMYGLINQEVTYIDKAWKNMKEFRENEPIQIRDFDRGNSRSLRIYNPSIEKE